MKITYNESFFLKVSKQELPIDGISIVMYHLLRRGKLFYIYNKVVVFISKQVKQQFISKDAINDHLNYSKCHNTHNLHDI